MENNLPLGFSFALAQNPEAMKGLCSKVRYRFWEKGHLLFDHTDDGASFEYAEKTTAR